MKTYVYTVINGGARGFNQKVSVHLLRGHNRPEWIGCNDEISTASTKGDYAEACQIIANNTPHRLDKGESGMLGSGYFLESKNINVYRV